MKRFVLHLSFVLMAIMILALPAWAAEHTVSITQIVEHPSLDAMQQGFKDRLAELGLDVAYNVHIAQGDPTINEQIANQIKGEAPDLVLAITTPSAQAVAQKIQDIPIVFTGVTDPVSAKLVAGLEAPGANITGMSDMSPMDKHLELILEFLPEMKALGVLYNAGEPNSVVLVDLLRAECAKKSVELKEATVDNSAAVYPAAKSLVGRVDAMYVPVDNTVVSALESAIKVCRQNRIPLFAGDTDSVARGSIAALAVDYYQMGVQTADMAKRILVDGEAPAAMPVEFIPEFGLHVNPASAETMGITVPQAILDKASKIVE